MVTIEQQPDHSAGLNLSVENLTFFRFLQKVATPGTFIDTFEDLSDHDEGDKSFDEDSEEGDDNEAGERNMNDGFIANTSFEQELTGNESTTFEDVTLDTL